MKTHILAALALVAAGGMLAKAAQAEGLGCTDTEKQQLMQSVFVQTAVESTRRSFTHISPDAATSLESLPSEGIRKALLSERGLSAEDEKTLRELAVANICKFTTGKDRQEMEAFYTKPENRDLLAQQYMLLTRMMSFQQTIARAKLAGIITKLP